MIEPQDVHVTVSGIDADGQEVSMSTRGTLRDLPGGWLLQYEEVASPDMEATRTTVIVEGARATVTRTGTLLSTLVFDERETFVGDYVTPVGSFQLRVLTASLSIQRRGGMGHVRVHYQVSLSTALSPLEETSSRQLDLRFRPCR